VAAGVRSTALTLGDAKLPLYAFGTAAVGCWALAGAAADLHPVYYAALLGSGAHLAWQVSTVDLGSPRDCLRKFQSNSTVGLLLFGALVLGKLLATAETRPAEDQPTSARADGEDARTARREEPRQPRTYHLIVAALRGS
jgi:hypothetical protein